MNGEVLAYRFEFDPRDYNETQEGIIEIYFRNKRVASIDADGNEYIGIPKDDPKYTTVKRKLEDYRQYVTGQALNKLSEELEMLKAELLFLTKGLDLEKVTIKLENEVNEEMISNVYDRLLKPYVNARVRVVENAMRQLRAIYAKVIREQIDKEREKIILSVMQLTEFGFKLKRVGGKWYFYYPGKIVPDKVIKNGVLYELKNDDEYYYIKGLYVPVSGKLRTGGPVFTDRAHHINVSDNKVCVGTMDGDPVTPENVIALFDMLHTMNADSAYFSVERNRIGKKIGEAM